MGDTASAERPDDGVALVDGAAEAGDLGAEFGGFVLRVEGHRDRSLGERGHLTGIMARRRQGVVPRAMGSLFFTGDAAGADRVDQAEDCLMHYDCSDGSGGESAALDCVRIRECHGDRLRFENGNLEGSGIDVNNCIPA
ncbi:hypothetical protein H9Q09_13330 [Aurantimonas sp. DM33-3]|uniref:hypothetical protein n=1 Tax=Aurantimonas sp. DM33-3 TaxID=2766955 RepID=UPI0016523B3C|nr:hypothetical protein [Aurantimonas sp. DM33-3]MBC6717191.1 hypothetical protein [Aurantimonas sp. DM33-3]